MPECKTCGKKYHACSSCGLTTNWEHVYCSEKCWKASKAYHEVKAKYLALYKTLNDAQRTLMKYFLDGSDDYWREYEVWEKEA